LNSLKRLLQLDRGGTDLAVALARNGRYSQRLIASMLSISRSNLGGKIQRENQMIIKKADINWSDGPILKHIREVILNRPSYGYRRVTAIMNAQRHASELDNIKYKRVYRIMLESDLLLSRYANRPFHVHDGRIITLHSNTRWCSDGFYITCDNGDRVQVAFSLDTCDREAMGYVASNKEIDGDMVSDLMAERGVCVDHSTTNHWVVNHASQLENNFKKNTNDKLVSVGGWMRRT
jgi:hypothetical protein